MNNINDKASELAKNEVVKQYMRELQKKGVKKRLQNDPNSFKKMARLRWEKENEEELTIKTE